MRIRGCLSSIHSSFPRGSGFCLGSIWFQGGASTTLVQGWSNGTNQGLLAPGLLWRPCDLNPSSQNESLSSDSTWEMEPELSTDFSQSLATCRIFSFGSKWIPIVAYSILRWIFFLLEVRTPNWLWCCKTMFIKFLHSFLYQVDFNSHPLETVLNVVTCFYKIEWTVWF